MQKSLILKTVGSLLLSWVMAWGIRAQDPIFSQFYAAPMQLNPAFAGNTYAPHIALNYRNQWPQLNKAYITYSAAYDQYFDALNSGIGIVFQADNAGNGIYKTNFIDAIYSYRLTVNDDFFVKMGANVGAIQTNVAWDKLVFLDQLDPITGSIDPSGNPIPTEEARPESLTKTYLNIGTGVLAYTPHLYGGISLNHLNRPDEAFYTVNDNLENGLPMRLTLHAGGQILIGEQRLRRRSVNDKPTFISPNIAFIQQGDFRQLNAGAYFSSGMFFGGAAFRHTFGNSDAVIFSAGWQMGVVKVGYSYDLTVSGLAGRSGGAHEVSLILNFETDRKADYNDCFNLFR